MSLKTVDTINFAGKRALIRVDFNVPLDKQYNVTDDTRIRSAIPTIKKILSDGGSVVLMSHLGRPLKKLNEDGTVNYRETFFKAHDFDFRRLFRRQSSVCHRLCQRRSICAFCSFKSRRSTIA
jgi:3-phosphoglycerate kinase